MSASNLNTARPEWTAGQVSVNAATDFRLVLEGKASNGGFAIDQLVLTPAGRQLLDTFKPAYYSLMDDAMSVLSESEVELFTSILNRFYAAIGNNVCLDVRSSS